MQITYSKPVSKGDNVCGNLVQFDESSTTFYAFPYTRLYLCSSRGRFGVPVVVSTYKGVWRVDMSVWNTEKLVVSEKFDDRDTAFLFALKLAEDYMKKTAELLRHATRTEIWDYMESTPKEG